MKLEIKPPWADDSSFLSGFLAGLLFGRNPSLLDVEKEAVLLGLNSDILKLLVTEELILVPANWREFMREVLKRRGN